MVRILEGLKPERVFYYFEELTRIPRGSGNEKQVSDYLYKLAVDNGWDVIQDKYLNIIIRKPATKGYENAPILMLQGHMDIVCEKNEGVIHDFYKDPVKLRIIDENIYATETTLGADNGIAVAMALSILESNDLPHPALEVLITSDEEKGMTGASNVDGNLFKSQFLINLDSEQEGSFTAGSAGGCKVKFKIKANRKEIESKQSYTIVVNGLYGGHSGIDIDKEKGNANKILGRVLYDILEITELVEINGGSKGNAIPRESKAVVCTDNIDEVKEKLSKWNKILANEYSFTDPNVKISIKNDKLVSNVLSDTVYKKIVAAINLIPIGPFSKNIDINLVIASNNLGIVTTNNEYIEIINNSRSSITSLLSDGFVTSMKQLAEILDIEIDCGKISTGWEYAKQSPLRDLCVLTYESIYGKKPLVGAIHAGLECGILMIKIKNLDAISMGPNMYDVHSPNEHVSIKSVENVYKLLCEILKRVK